ncbi:MAG: hypothetical protein WA058_01460 [Minisyncoccia bacterium]
MNRINTYLVSLGKGARVAILSLAVVFVGAGIAQATAATTIGSNISTTGTLGVTGVSTFTNSSTTQSATIAGPLWVGGNATTTAAGALSLKSTLTVAGLATLSAGATTTSLTLGSSDTIKNATASSTVLSGSLTVGGTGATGATLTVSNGTTAATATSTATVGCIITTATSTQTPIRLMFNDQATTTALNSNTVRGVVLWSYGSSCAN